MPKAGNRFVRLVLNLSGLLLILSSCVSIAAVAGFLVLQRLAQPAQVAHVVRVESVKKIAPHFYLGMYDIAAVPAGSAKSMTYGKIYAFQTARIENLVEKAIYWIPRLQPRKGWYAPPGMKKAERLLLAASLLSLLIGAFLWRMD